MTVTAVAGRAPATETANAGERLTADSHATMLAEASALLEQALRDNSYRDTPIGRLVTLYLDELQFENYSKETRRNREQLLSKLAVRFAHRNLADVTADELRVWLAQWKDAAVNTRAVYVSTVKTFTAWAHERDHTPADAGRKIRGPRAQDAEREVLSQDDVRKLIVAQDTLRDRIGVLFLYWCGLRRNELRLIQFRHVNLSDRLLTVFGKGGTVLEQNIPQPLALPFERYILDRQPHANEYLLHPQRIGRLGAWPLYTEKVIWEDRFRPLSAPGLDKWWQRCVARAGMPQFGMHAMRHTAGTHFHQEGHDLVATQHFMRHKNPATTARTYVHLDRVRAVADVQRRMVDPLEGQ